MTLASKYLNPKNDLAFKQIFGEKKNKDILIAMLNVVLKNQLHKPIKQVEFLKTSQDPRVAVEKQSIVDVLCEDQDGCKYIIEMVRHEVAQRSVWKQNRIASKSCYHSPGANRAIGWCQAGGKAEPK